MSISIERLQEIINLTLDEYADDAGQTEIYEMAKQLIAYRLSDLAPQVWQYREAGRDGKWSAWCHITEKYFNQHLEVWKGCAGIYEGAKAEIRRLGVIKSTAVNTNKSAPINKHHLNFMFNNHLIPGTQQVFVDNVHGKFAGKC